MIIITTTKKAKMGRKQLCEYFKRQTNEISLEKTKIDRDKTENLKTETEPLQIAAQNNAIETNYVKVKIDKTLKNSKYRWCGDR